MLPGADDERMVNKMTKNEMPSTTAMAEGKRLKRGRGGNLTTVHIIALLFAIVALAVIYWPKDHYFEARYFVVKEGQTLWEIGRKCQEMGDSRDVREIIYHICKDNGLGQHIYPGQELRVFVEVDYER